MQNKKQLLLGFNLIFLSLILTACGFHLRSSVDLPAAYRSVYIDSAAGEGILKRELTEQLGYSNGSVVALRSEADSVIHILDENKETRTLSLSRGGKSTELELTYRVQYELLDKEGNVLLEAQKLEMVCNYFNDQTDVLGKSNEESLIFKEMQRQVADSLLRRIRAVLAE
jgi:LPS-assembly lipoprotein